MSYEMRFASILLLAFPAAVFSQQQRDPFSSEVVKHGEEVYAKVCTFCHGEAGAGGSSAPVLARRGLDASYIDRVVNYGVPETAMAAWGQRLMAPDLMAVSSYVKSLNGIVPPPNANSLRVLSGDAAAGRDLFFDSNRGLASCSNCHSVTGKGIKIAPEIMNVPADTTALRSVSTSHLSTAVVGAESFPALVTAQVRNETKLYDLTTVPPVLRTLPSAAVKITPGSGWQHASVTVGYSSQELELILAFLRASVSNGQPGKSSLTADDYLEIQQLYAHYNYMIDSGDAEGYAATFTPDGAFNTNNGHDALIAFIRGRKGSNLRHWNANLAITGTPEGAKGSVYLLLVDVSARPPALATAAKYDDLLVKTPDGWRFKKRVTKGEGPPAPAAPPR